MTKVYKKIAVIENHGFYEFDFISGHHFSNKDDIIKSIEDNMTKVYLLGIDNIPDDIIDIRHLMIDDFALHIYAYRINNTTSYFSILPIYLSDADLIQYAKLTR